MRLSEDDLQSIIYFMFEKDDIERWALWEDKKDLVLSELPALRVLLEKERELAQLKAAVKLVINGMLVD